MNMLIGAIIAVAILAVVLSGQIPKIGEKQRIVMIETQKARISSCQLEGMYGNYKDTDNDRYPDDCDVCLGAKDSIDTDKDGIPDGCDKEPNKPANKKIEAKLACAGKGEWDPNLRSCILSEYYQREPRLGSAGA